MADFMWEFSNVIRITLGVALAALAMSVARDALFNEDTDDDAGIESEQESTTCRRTD